MTALRNKKNTVIFSIKIPHLTSTVYHLLSDRLRESPGLLPLTMLKRNPFGRVLPHKRTLLRFPDARSEKRKIQAQKDREATIPTQNPSTYTIVSFQFTTNSIFPVKPTPSRISSSAISDGPRTHSPRQSLVTLSSLQSVLRRVPHHYLSPVVLDANWRWGPWRGSVCKGGRVTKLVVGVNVYAGRYCFHIHVFIRTHIYDFHGSWVHIPYRPEFFSSGLIFQNFCA